MTNGLVMPVLDIFQPTPCQMKLWAFIASQESGELSVDSLDRGNWTSGIVGVGELKGSKWGVSAAAFPALDIANITYDQAMQICMAHYWPAVRGDQCIAMHVPALAMLLVDAAWGSGPMPAIAMLQRALRLDHDDGRWGPVTQAALQRALAAPPLWALRNGQHDVLADFIAERILFESNAENWGRYKGGWIRRMARIAFLVQEFVA